MKKTRKISKWVLEKQTIENKNVLYAVYNVLLTTFIIRLYLRWSSQVPNLYNGKLIPYHNETVSIFA